MYKYEVSTKYDYKLNYFDNFVSNTTAGSGNQHVFRMEKGEIRTGRIFYRISVGGRYNYSLLFSNITDSTYSDGTVSHKNMICEPWTIHSAKIGKCTYIPKDKPIEKLTVSDCGEGDICVDDLRDITFDGNPEKTVHPGEFFSTDPIELEFKKDEYLCLELTFSGSLIPYHEESLLPVYTKTEKGWEYSLQMPYAGMVGCDRKVKARIAFWGDSITQGIGTDYNSYDHWNARLAEALGEEYAYWNLGIGFARAADAASGGAWHYKAKHNDIAVVCFGVNDIFHDPDGADAIAGNIERIIDNLHRDGVKVILQSVPPFGYQEPERTKWEEVNGYVCSVLSKKADAFFDNGDILGVPGEPHRAIYGGHPNAEGCKLWAEALYPVMKEFLERL